MGEIRTVRDLVAVLLLCDPGLPVAVHVNGHSWDSSSAGSHGSLRVALADSFGGRHVMIGNLGLFRDCANERLVRELDGAGALPRKRTE